MPTRPPLLNEARLPVTDPNSMVASLTIQAEPGEERRASLWIKQVCLEHAVPVEQCSRLELCLNEALANVLSHGGETALSEPVCLQFDINRNASFCQATVTVIDAGIKFDLHAVSPKPRPQTLAEAEPGGLGLLMLQRFTDALNYCYRDSRNHLSFSVHWMDTP